MPDPRTLATPFHLEVRLRDRIGALSLDVSFQTGSGWTVLFGPSGSGKTTLLRAIAGFHRPTEGVISLHRPSVDPLVLFDSARHIHLPIHTRPLRVAAQQPALFPHRTVAENTRYGVGARKDIADGTLDRLHLTTLAVNRIEQLSGGEAQRVSVARAIAAARAAGPGTWLLLDEPFTGLDLRLRTELTRDLREWLRELQHPVLSVTHDVAEVFALGAEVIRLEAGRVIAQGPPEKVLAEERIRVLAALDFQASLPPAPSP